jgi:G3E family GTPase
MPATKLTPSAKARKAEQRKRQADRVNERIKTAVAKAVAKEREKWRAKLETAREGAAERVQRVKDRVAAAKETKRVRFWERKMNNGSAVETTREWGSGFGPRSFSY